jgi:exodeoxyribonuclease V alpha subunit
VTSAYSTDGGDGALAEAFDTHLVLGAPGLLAAFNQAGLLAASDVHVATRLARMGGETDEQVVLAAALAVSGPRHGHVRVDLFGVPASVSASVAADADDVVAADADGVVPTESLPWPEPEAWMARVAASPLVSLGPDGPEDRPLRLIGTALYLDRYWRDEGAVAEELRARSAGRDLCVDEDVLAEGIRRLFPAIAAVRGAPGDTPGNAADDQRNAAESAVRHAFSVVAGGPGTGKTTTVAKVIALLFDQSSLAASRRPLVALAAPTGKAAARMQEAVRAAAVSLPLQDSARACLAGAEAMTIHRLLRRRPDSSSRFVHDRYNRLPHDVVIVDEMSMVSLSLMARLLEAVRTDARLILVGDPEQLASVEAGAVMADVVAGLGDRVSRLTSNYRFSGSLAALSEAVRSGDAGRAIRVLRDPGDGRVAWIEGAAEAGTGTAQMLEPLRESTRVFGKRLFEAASAGDVAGALQALGSFRLLCAHRRGPAGVQAWTGQMESWLTADVDGFSPQPGWYLGRPVMITANDYTLRLFNGDTGTVVARKDGPVTAVFDQGGRTAFVSPSRLSDIETVFAMTVHKSQGSEFDHVAMVLPPASSPLLTRELLYTAVTRARASLLLVGPEDSVRAAVERPVARTSGLAERLRA